MPVTIPSVSRRGFLKMGMALGAAMALPRGLQAGNLPMTLVPAAPAPIADHLALLSDVHVSGGLNSGMAKRLSTAVEQVLDLPEAPQKVLLSGDCAYLTGSGQDYKEFVKRIAPLATAGLPVHMTLGNHDHRDRFWDALPAGHAEANLAIHRQSMVVPGHHANWFMLDSLDKTNHDSGELGGDQLDWLAAELDARAKKPAIVMLHHEPFRKGRKGSLSDSEKLMGITRPRRHVKAIFFGHTHVWDVAEDQSGIHLINLPATGYTLWMQSFLGWVSCHVYKDSAALQVRTLKMMENEHGQIFRLKWRA
jgi:3',5'-cyclic-AMP phosphodiesterase